MLLAFAWLLMGTTPRLAVAATARVQYLSSTNVYLDAGSAEGLAEGAVVTVTHGGKKVAQLTAVYVALHSSSCRVDSLTDVVRVGDAATFVAAAISDSLSQELGAGGAAATTPGGSGAAGGGSDRVDQSWSPPRHLSGHVMTLYTRTSDDGGSYENPSVLGDLRWSGRLQEQLSLRVFATQPTTRATTDLPGLSFNESETRIYEVAAQYRNPSGRLDAAGGRFLAPRLEALGYVDGVGASWRARPAIAFGAAVGKGSDLGVAGFNSQGVRVGAWLETARQSPARRWRALLSGGFLGDSSLTRRQFVTERIDFWPQRNNVIYQSVEVDFNPGWKRQLGEGAVTLTAWSMGGSFQFQPRLWVTLAADSRKPLLLPEQRFVPSLPPLDRYTGIHASSRYDLSADQTVWIGGAVRRRDRDGKMYQSWDLGMNTRRIVSQAFSGGVHGFGYNDGPATGINADVNLAARLRPWSTLELSGGYGGMLGDAGAAGVPEYRSRWVRAGLDLRGPEASWVRVAHEWQGGGPGNELTAELGLSF